MVKVTLAGLIKKVMWNDDNKMR